MRTSEIRRAIGNHKGSILLAGHFGSREEDQDILVIFKKPDLKVYGALCRQLRQAATTTFFYPTFRLQSLWAVRRRACRSWARPVHLLVYPSKEAFLEMERPFVRHCILRSVTPWIGTPDAIGTMSRIVPKSNLTYYVNLLFETAQLHFTAAMPEPSLTHEIRGKLLYVIKFALLERFYREGGAIDLSNIADSLFAALPRPLRKKATPLYVAIRKWKQPSPSAKERAFQQALELLEDL